MIKLVTKPPLKINVSGLTELINIIVERLIAVPGLLYNSRKLPRFWQVVFIGVLVLNFGSIGLAIYFRKFEYPSWSNNLICGCFVVLMVTSAYLNFFTTREVQKKAEKPLVVSFLAVLLLIQITPFFK
jgi:hypothetical protein